MKNENERIELNIIKGMIGINNISSITLHHEIITGLELLSYYTKYKIAQINFVSPIGVSVHGVRKNGKEIRLAQRAWGRKYEK